GAEPPLRHVSRRAGDRRSAYGRKEHSWARGGLEPAALAYWNGVPGTDAISDVDLRERCAGAERTREFVAHGHGRARRGIADASGVVERGQGPIVGASWLLVGWPA